MSRRILCSLLLTLVFTSSWAWAHPGHGATPAEEPAHYILEPIHGWPLIVGAGLAIVAWRRYRSRA